MTFETLEFDKILNLLCEQALSERVKEKIILLEPYLNEKEVNNRMNETTEAKMIIENIGTPPLASMKEIEKIITLVQTNTMLLPEQLTSIAQFLTSCRRIKSYLKRTENINTQIGCYGNSINSLDDLYNEIQTNIVNNRVDDMASSSLKDVRKKIESINTQIKIKLDNILRSKKEYFIDSYVTTRNGHYTLPVKKEYKHYISGSTIDISQSGSTYFIEPSIVVNLKQELSLLQIEEDNEVRKILYTLTAFVEDYLSVIKLNIEAMETLDFVFAKAKLSIQMKAIPVKVTSNKKIIIKSGRHPLINKDTVVPIDFEIGSNVTGIVITGPNTGGKTVALKTVGLLSIMAQSGLHVPVNEESQFCMHNMVLCDIGDGQSISENLSTFSSHIKNIINILNTGDNESLILLDELGSGTDPAEGMGIAIAILEELKKKDCLFIATTHYPEVKEFTKTTNGLLNARMEFDRQSLKPLYKLTVGEAGESCALYIAQKLGLPSNMLKRAYYEAYGIETTKFIEDEVQQQQNKIFIKNHIQKQVDKPNQKQNNKFHIGDSVMVYPKKLIGIVYKEVNNSGEIVVQIKGKKELIKQKRVKLITAASELYPPDYDFSIIFDTVENRKARHIINKKYSQDLEIKYENETYIK